MVQNYFCTQVPQVAFKNLYKVPSPSSVRSQKGEPPGKLSHHRIHSPQRQTKVPLGKAQRCSEEGVLLGPLGPTRGKLCPQRMETSGHPTACYSCLISSSMWDPGYVASIMGRRRPLPRVHDQDQHLRAQAERQAVNFVVQGTQSPLPCLLCPFASWVLSSCRAE